jgi:FHA domain-containing protein
MTSSMLSLRVVSQMGTPLAAPLHARFDAGGTIGRSPDCTLVLPDPGRHISREQARIERVAQGYIIRCTGSASAIVLNGVEVGPGEHSPLRVGDHIVVAEYEIAVEQPPVAAAPAQPPAVSRPPPQPMPGLAPMPSASFGTPRAAGTIDDPFAALGLGAAPSSIDDPLGGFGLGVQSPHAAPAPAPGAPPDLLGLGSSHQQVLDSSRRASDNLDAMFDLAGASPDPLGLGSSLSGPASQPNTASSSDPLASLGMTAKAQPASMPDTTPEVAGVFRMPEAIPPTNFGFDGGGSVQTSTPAPRPVAPAPVSPAPVSPAPVPPSVPLPPAAPATARALGADGIPAQIPASAAFLSWNQPEEISPTITISKLLPELPSASPPGQAPMGIAGRSNGPEPLAPDQIRAIADEIAERHRVDFEPPPKTRPTDFLNELNRAQVEALRAEVARTKAGRETAQAASESGARGAAMPAGSGAGVLGGITPEQLEQLNFELLKGLLLGLGLSELPRPPLASRGAPPQLSPELMRRLGELVRVATQGTIDLLQARATLKREMKTEVTMIASRDNNPLKFSPDAHAALAHLLSTQSIRGFLDPVPALKDSYDDLLAHQVGFIAGMRAAMQGLIARFDPAVLEGRLTRKSVLDSMLPMGRKGAPVGIVLRTLRRYFARGRG